MSTIKIALTGHRPPKLGGYNPNTPLNQAIYHILADFVDIALTQYDHVIGISGMALGADTMWAQALVDAQDAGKSVELHAYIPCSNQSSRWPLTSQRRNADLCARASKQRQFATEYTPQCMQERNEGMIDDCDLLIAIYDGTHGGTHNAVEYAKQQYPALPIMYINPNRIREMISEKKNQH